jgi:LacI family transcriptional regulator
VVGFDDILSASYHVPSLTTVRQPLQAMGELAATTLLRKMAHERQPDTLRVDPELMVRESTGPAPAATAHERSSPDQKRKR